MAARVLALHDIKEESESFGKRINDLINLINHGFYVSDAFIITQEAFLDFLKHNNLEKKVEHLTNLDASEHIDKYLKHSVLPNDLIKEILKEYKKFGTVLENAEVNLFFSDFSNSPTQKIGGEVSLLEKIKEMFISIYSQNPSKNPTAIVQKIHFGKHGKIRTSSKFINTAHALSANEVLSLENMITKFKSIFYIPYEIDFTLEKNNVLINKVSPETHVAFHDVNIPQTYRIIKNSTV